MNRNKIEEVITDILADIFVNTAEFAQGFYKSSLTIVLTGTAAYFLWNWVFGAVFTASYLQAMALAVIGRLLAGPAAIAYEPPLDSEERALLLRQAAEDEGGPSLRVLPHEED